VKQQQDIEREIERIESRKEPCKIHKKTKKTQLEMKMGKNIACQQVRLHCLYTSTT